SPANPIDKSHHTALVYKWRVWRACRGQDEPWQPRILRSNRHFLRRARSGGNWSKPLTTNGEFCGVPIPPHPSDLRSAFLPPPHKEGRKKNTPATISPSLFMGEGVGGWGPNAESGRSKLRPYTAHAGIFPSPRDAVARARGARGEGLICNCRIPRYDDARRAQCAW